MISIWRSSSKVELNNLSVKQQTVEFKNIQFSNTIHYFWPMTYAFIHVLHLIWHLSWKHWTHKASQIYLRDKNNNIKNDVKISVKKNTTDISCMQILVEQHLCIYIYIITAEIVDENFKMWNPFQIPTKFDCSYFFCHPRSSYTDSGAYPFTMRIHWNVLKWYNRTHTHTHTHTDTLNATPHLIWVLISLPPMSNNTKLCINCLHNKSFKRHKRDFDDTDSGSHCN